MTTKHIRGNYPGGYTLAAGYGELIIDAGAYVGGSGVTAPSFATILNHGSVSGVDLQAGGEVINGTTRNTSASIMGYRGGISASYGAVIANFGTVASGMGLGSAVGLADGGSVTNGSATDVVALISGYYGIIAGGYPSTVVNFGTIEGVREGVTFENGGKVTNGSIADRTASITGVWLDGAASAVTNFGTIATAAGAPADVEAGVYLRDGGAVTNGSAADTGAVISGSRYGVLGAVVLYNFGTIEASGAFGAGVTGSTIVNGAASDTRALIMGDSGCGIGDSASLTNYGTIAGVSNGVDVGAGRSSVINGSGADTAAMISGDVGVRSEFGNQIALANYGTIQGSSKGIYLDAGGTVTNGSINDRNALIKGGFGFEGGGYHNYVTVDNFGVIDGTENLSVSIGGAGSELIAEAGSTFIGEIEAYGARLVLSGGGTGTISNLGQTGKLTGAVSAYFFGFGSFEIAAGGAWTLAGPNTLNDGDALIDEGTLVNRGALTIGGTLTVGTKAVFRLAAGSITAGPTGAASIIDHGLMIKNPGTGTTSVGVQVFDFGIVEVASGTLDFTSHLLGTGVLKIDGGATLEADAAAVSTLTTTFDGPTATLALKIPNAFHATIGGLVAGDTIDLLALTATGASVNGSDQLVAVNGTKTVATLQLSGNYVGATFATAADGHGGTNVKLVSGGGSNLPSVHAMTAIMASIAGQSAEALTARETSTRLAPLLVNTHVHLQ